MGLVGKRRVGRNVPDFLTDMNSLAKFQPNSSYVVVDNLSTYGTGNVYILFNKT